MELTDLSVKKPHNIRRSHPKVKSGCVTCKIRRVKCDEQRPSCLRCIKFGAICDGYAPPKRQKRLVERSKAILLPKSQNPRFYPVPILLPTPILPRFENDYESRYFNVFSTNTAYEIFPNVEMGRLRVMFLQACDSMESIRHAVIALGALDMTAQASLSGSSIHHPAQAYSGNPSSHHYQFAVKEYARALKYAQMEGEKDFRAALITSLVILSFEGWVGKHEVAVQQIQLGTRLLKEWKERRRQQTAPGFATPLPSGEEDLLTHVFTRLSIQLRSPPPRVQSPSPSPASPPPLPPLKIDTPESLKRMPQRFETLREAEKYYSLIVRFAITFVTQAMPRIARSSSLTGAYDIEGATETVSPEIANVQAALTESLHGWMAAFEPLKLYRRLKTLDETRASITLELQMKATYMGAAKSLAQDELVFDDYIEIYKDIVNLSEALLQASNAARVPKFSFDSGVIIPLWFTGQKCREPVLRRRVISLLLEYPRREGVWDSVFAGLVIECIRGFEEAYMEKGMVPGWARIHKTKFDIDMKKRTVEVICEQRISATSDETVIRRKTVDYYVNTGITLEQVGAIIAR